METVGPGRPRAQLSLFSGPPPEQRRQPSEGGEQAEIAGFAGAVAGPRQTALLEQLDAGRHVSEQQLLEAALLDDGCRLRRQQHTVADYRLRPPAKAKELTPRQRAQAWAWADRAFQRFQTGR